MPSLLIIFKMCGQFPFRSQLTILLFKCFLFLSFFCGRVCHAGYEARPSTCKASILYLWTTSLALNYKQFLFFFFGSMFRITSDGVHGILCNAREQAWVSCAEGNHLTYCSILSRRIINKFKRVVKNFLYCGNAENINFNWGKKYDQIEVPAIKRWSL